MNIYAPLKTSLKSVAAIALTLGFASTAFAADHTSEFGVTSNATRSIRSAASAFAKGDFANSEAYSRRALKEGLKKSRKAVAYSNLCAALGAQGELEAAQEACASALKIAPKNEQALANQAALKAHAGSEMEAEG
ncbi:MAG: hypothetical protein COA43_10505 [Robiginitomaculum sp.]|nr:MAG: hypothetical protein COA43_10505 [Robiginitomaculum sp.]